MRKTILRVRLWWAIQLVAEARSMSRAHLNIALNHADDIRRDLTAHR